MNTQSTFPYLSWTPQDIANAVPLRLFEMFAFEVDVDAEADADGPGPQRSANQLPAARRWRGGYRPQAQLPPRLLVR